MIQILCETVIFISSHTLLKAGNEAWCSYIAVSGCISETLTLPVGSSGRWNISFATVSNPVYGEANVSPVKGTWEENTPIQSQVEPALHAGLQSPKTDLGLFSDNVLLLPLTLQSYKHQTGRSCHLLAHNTSVTMKICKRFSFGGTTKFQFGVKSSLSIETTLSINFGKHTSAEAPQCCGVPHLPLLGPTWFPLFMLPLRSITESVKFICL